jgi:hypothetical protein
VRCRVINSLGPTDSAASRAAAFAAPETVWH